jgi:predicted O-methyltransferase YrrM
MVRSGARRSTHEDPMQEKPQTAVNQDDLVAAIDKWLGKSRSCYDFWKVGKLMAAADTAEFFVTHMPTVPLYKSRIAFHGALFPQREIPGLILEFGVAGGQTVNRLAELYPDETIYGFDSFEGLPEAWRADYQKGHFAQELPQVKDNVQLVVGWFDQTLPKFLADHAETVSLLHVDCDLYVSTRIIFEKLGHAIRPGTLIVFDEYFNYPGWRDHEHKAFMEFVEASRIDFSYLGATKSNKQVAVRINGVG